MRCQNPVSFGTSLLYQFIFSLSPICLVCPAPTHNVSLALQVQHLANLLHFKLSKSILQARRSWQRQRQASRAKRAQKQSSKHREGHHGLHLHLPWRRHRESNADQICRWHLLSVLKPRKRFETPTPTPELSARN